MAAGRPIGDLHVSAAVVIPAAELQWRFSRSSGPGGQNVNKVETAVELGFDLEGYAFDPKVSDIDRKVFRRKLVPNA